MNPSWVGIQVESSGTYVTISSAIHNAQKNGISRLKITIVGVGSAIVPGSRSRSRSTT
jgi:hypothetical protein